MTAAEPLDWPLTDPARLAAVDATGLLDTPAESAFDELAALAARLTGMPLAFVTFVDDRRSYWKATVGTGIAPEDVCTRQNAVADSFCQYVILADAPVVVTDAAQDERTRGNPSVTTTGVRAWAGYPVRGPDGHVLGSFCVVDLAPRQFSAADLEVLETLATAATREVALRAALRRAQDTTVELARLAARQELMARILGALHRKLDPIEELRELASVVVPDLADTATVHVLRTPVRPGRRPENLPVITDRVATAVIPEVPLPAERTGLAWHGEEGDPVVEVVRHGRLLRRPATPDVPRWARSTGSERTFLAGVDQVVVVPVVVEGLVVAVVFFGLHRDREPWDDEDLDQLEEIARYAGLALANSLTYQRTRDSALVLQRSLLTDPPAVPGLEIAACYAPAGHDEVGGDWYDVFALGSDEWAVVVGDVVGHDIAAAAAMSQLRSALRTLATDRDRSPAATLTRLSAVNRALGLTDLATVFYGRLRHGPAGWTLRWCSAGHPPPLVLAASRAGVRTLGGDPGEIALNRFLPGVYSDAETTLAPGDVLLMYTDGVIEVRGTDLAAGWDELAARAADALHLGVSKLCGELLPKGCHDDDAVVLVLRVLP